MVRSKGVSALASLDVMILHFFFFPAVLLLCLLDAAFARANDYSWGGPGPSTDRVDPNTENGEQLFVK